MKGDSKFILPLYARMMNNEKIVDAIKCLPDKLEYRDVMLLISLGIPIVQICRSRDKATKDRILDYILEKTLEYVKYMRQSQFRSMAKSHFFLAKSIRELPEKLRMELKKGNG